jgi:hypothetical protein
MSKKAAEVVEAAPKFKQPWQGFLGVISIIVLSYITYQWFLNPIWGLATKMIQANIFIAYWMAYFFGITLYPATAGVPAVQLAFILSVNNPMFTQLYPLGYLVDWSSLFVFAIVWAISLVALIKPGTTSKQPWTGIYILVLSLILGFVTWFILGFKLQWTGEDMILLGVVGFLVLTSEAMIFNHWPFVEKRADVHPVFRGSALIAIGWIITFLVRGALVKLIWSNPIGTFWTQYLGGNLAQPLFSTYPWDFIISGVISIIFAMYIVSIHGPLSGMRHPTRGIINWIIGLIIGVIMWLIVAAIVARGQTQVLITNTSALAFNGVGVVPLPISWVLTTSSSNYNQVSLYLTFPFITLLFGQMVFQMWPWTRFGRWQNLIWVILAFIIGTIIYYIMIVNPGYAYTITGANLITSQSGMQSLYLWYLETYLTGIANLVPAAFLTPLIQNFMAYVIYFEGLAKTMETELMFAWLFFVQIFFIMIYEGFEHWPWK